MRDLAPDQRQQVQHRRPAGQRLADGTEQREIGRAGEDEAARLPPGVDLGLEIREQLRHPLDLVQDGPVTMVAEKPARIVAGVLANVRGFERHVGFVGEDRAAQRGLAGLTRPRDGHHRKLAGGRAKSRREGTGDHAPHGTRTLGLIESPTFN